MFLDPICAYGGIMSFSVLIDQTMHTYCPLALVAVLISPQLIVQQG